MSIIGIDLGAKRIGIAVSDSGVMATPHSVLRNEGDIIEKLTMLGQQLDTKTFVVGVPRRPGTNEQRFHDFAERLRQKSCKEVVLWDESLSTVDASELLRAMGSSRRQSQQVIDMHAAAVILQSWLDDRARRMS